MSNTRVMEPTRIAQGEQISWTRVFDDYPATLWTLEYRFAGESAQFHVTATADGSGFDATITPTQSTNATPGRWIWQAWATSIADGHSELVKDGFLVIIAGLTHAGGAAVETRSAAQIMVDTLDAAIQQSGDILRYDITTPAGEHKVFRQPRADVIALRKYYAGIVSREKAAQRVRTTGRFGQAVNFRVTEEG